MDCVSGLKRCSLEDQTNRVTVVGVGLVYFGYFVFAFVGIVLMISNDEEEWPVVFSSNVVFVTSALHFGFTTMGYVVYKEYEHAQVDPVWLFLFADYFQAAALGAAIASRIMDAASRPIVYASASIVMLAQLACFYKTVVLLSNPQAARSKRRQRAQPPSLVSLSFGAQREDGTF